MIGSIRQLGSARAAHVYALLVVAAALAIAAALWLHAAGPGAHAAGDFRDYLRGARAIAVGRDPYAPLVQQAADTRPGAHGFHAYGYVYPPLLAFALALPVRLRLDERAVWLLWNGINVAAVAWMGRELNCALRGRRDWPASLAFAAAILLSALATYDLWLGQADLLMAALVVGACALWLRRNPWAGLALGVAIAIKPTMALVLLVWLWKGDWRAALRGALAAAALVLLPFALIGLPALRDYLDFLRHWNAFQGSAEYINQSPYGMLLRLFTANIFTRPLVEAPWLVAPLRVAVTLGAAGWWLRAVPRARAADPALAMGECLLALPLILLFSPLAEDIHYCVLLPALVGLGWLAFDRGIGGLSLGARSSGGGAGVHRTPLQGGHTYAAWVVWGALAFCWIPRMQELIYPDHLLALPGQGNPTFGPYVTLLRSGTLLYVALATLLAGSVVLRAARAAKPVPLEQGRDTR